MVRVDDSEAVNSYLLKISFKRWGKLWSPGNVRLHSIAEAERLERRDYYIGTTLYQLPLPAAVKKVVTEKRYGLKKRLADRSARDESLPTCFLLECYNPQPYEINLSLTMRSADQNQKISFQKMVELAPGFHRTRIPLNEIRTVLDIRSPFNIDLIPNDVEDGTTLFFGLMDFVQEVEQAARKIKCVVWDLDNTLWEGIVVEDGPDKLKLKPGIAKVIRLLDERGILQSIASKNNYAEAVQVLKKTELDKYFLCPQISWGPKSEGIKVIARELNIGMDSILFVDDSRFEREEVRTAYPEVRILDALEFRSLPQMRECQVQVTDESRGRRKMYQVEAERRDVAMGFGEDYMAFLKHCQIQLSIRPMGQENIDRVHELTQRTNQMNFSGNRYDRDALKRILSTSHLRTYALSCKDRFGSYGIVGFSIVDVREPRMIDLMFSCRVQSKRIEHAFLSHIIKEYVDGSGRNFFANYRKTSKNAPSGQVFADLGMEEVQITDGLTSLVFRGDREVPNDGVIMIVEEEALLGVV